MGNQQVTLRCRHCGKPIRESGRHSSGWYHIRESIIGSWFCEEDGKSLDTNAEPLLFEHYLKQAEQL